MKYVKTFDSMLDSSIWLESDATRIVWLTMLLMADPDGFVRASDFSLARRARVSLRRCVAALSVLSAPDPRSTTVDHGGRRVTAVDGGWRLVNYLKYRALMSSEDTRLKSRERHRDAPQSVTCDAGDAFGDAGDAFGDAGDAFGDAGCDAVTLAKRRAKTAARTRRYRAKKRPAASPTQIREDKIREDKSREDLRRAREAAAAAEDRDSAETRTQQGSQQGRELAPSSPLEASLPPDRLGVAKQASEPVSGQPEALAAVRRPAQPASPAAALELPILERSRALLENPYMAQFVRPQEWPEIVAFAKFFARVAQQRAVRIGHYESDAGLRNAVRLYADGWTQEALRDATQAAVRSQWWRSGEGRGWSSLTVEVLRRAENARPERVDVDADTAREIAKMRALSAQIGSGGT